MMSGAQLPQPADASSSLLRSRRTALVCSWHTRDSVTPSTSADFGEGEVLEVIERDHYSIPVGELRDRLSKQAPALHGIEHGARLLRGVVRQRLGDRRAAATHGHEFVQRDHAGEL